MSQRHLVRALVVTAVGAGLAVSVVGCASDDGAQYQTQLSSIQAQQSAQEATVAAARGFTQDLGPVYALPPGPERAKWFEKSVSTACPGSETAKEYQKSKDTGWIDRLQHQPGTKTEVIGAFPDKNPGEVIVVARTLGLTPPPGQKYFAQVSRMTIGTSAGKPCVSKIVYL